MIALLDFLYVIFCVSLIRSSHVHWIQWNHSKQFALTCDDLWLITHMIKHQEKLNSNHSETNKQRRHTQIKRKDWLKWETKVLLQVHKQNSTASKICALCMYVNRCDDFFSSFCSAVCSLINLRKKALGNGESHTQPYKTWSFKRPNDYNRMITFALYFHAFKPKLKWSLNLIIHRAD